MSDAKIKVFIKRPGEVPYSTAISPRLENLKKIVGEDIGVGALFSDFALLCNEKGKQLGLPFNCHLFGADFYGTIIFTGVTPGADFADVPLTFKEFKRQFPALWEVEE